MTLAANIDMAIRACRQEEDDLLRNKQNMRIIKESLNNGYCDVSGHGGDMMIAGMNYQCPLCVLFSLYFGR